MLGKARVVAATITPLEAGYAHVQLSADLRMTRGAFIGGAAAFVSVGAAATAVMAVLGAFPLVLLLPLPAAIAAGVRGDATLRRRRRADPARPGAGAGPAGAARQPPDTGSLPPQRNSMITSLVQEVRKALKP